MLPLTSIRKVYILYNYTQSPTALRVPGGYENTWSHVTPLGLKNPASPLGGVRALLESLKEPHERNTSELVLTLQNQKLLGSLSERNIAGVHGVFYNFKRNTWKRLDSKTPVFPG